MSSSIGTMKFPTEWKNKACSSHHQPVHHFSPSKIWLKKWCRISPSNFVHQFSPFFTIQKGRFQQISWVPSPHRVAGLGAPSLGTFIGVASQGFFWGANHWSIEPFEAIWTITGWWFQLLWKILVNWDDYSQYMEKYKMSKPPTSDSMGK